MRGQSSSSSQEQLKPRIGIDLMSGDSPLEILLPPILEFARQIQEHAFLSIFAPKAAILNLSSIEKNVQFFQAEEVITMEDDPLVAIRRKKQSSLCLGIEMLKKKEIDAFISLGNTGALIAKAKTTLAMLPFISRPALLTVIPTKFKEIAILDIGANIEVTAEHLFQFALMGIAYQKTRGISSPSVALLNIGTEEKKGTKELRLAYQKLQTLNLNTFSSHSIFTGNIEGRDVFQSQIDVLVTDGFIGNIFLKTAEGLASFILDSLYDSSKELPSNHLKTVLMSLENQLNYRQYPGAILCGVDGIVIKCHGNSKVQGLINSIQSAIQLIQQQFLDQIKIQLQT